jgi:murein DD-endopeptidase MepM/ murein hydrolase activator NlpD
VLQRFAYRLNLALEPWLPEQRLFLKSDSTTRFVRLRPLTQATGIVLGTVVTGWTLLASALLIVDMLGQGSGREMASMRTEVFAERLEDLSADRDLRVVEAASAQSRFNQALAQVSRMQEALLASQTRLRELETGIDVIQKTLRRTIDERDSARAEAAEAQAALIGQGKATMGQAEDLARTVDLMTEALGDAAKSRDAMAGDVAKAEARMAEVAKAKAEVEARNAIIFAKLEEALTVSVEPLEKMFKAAGLNPDDLLKAARSGYAGQGGPLVPIKLSTMGLSGSPDETRANAILSGLDTLNTYRMAAFKVPLGLPLKTSFRMTSSFGGRNDPINGSRKMHEGQDLAGDYGDAIYSTADGVVTYAGWENGYGRLIKIRHAFGIETRYGHLSEIGVKVGQRVSRGEKIGDMGNSGRSTGTHLHYEVRLSGTAVNPMTFIRAARDVF